MYCVQGRAASSSFEPLDARVESRSALPTGPAPTCKKYPYRSFVVFQCPEHAPNMRPTLGFGLRRRMPMRSTFR